MVQKNNNSPKLNSSKIPVGIIGASGYTGVELVRLLANHPNFNIEVVTGHSTQGKLLSEIYPSIGSSQGRLGGLVISDEASSIKDLMGCDLVFSCLPHGKFMKSEFLKKALSSTDSSIPKIIDLSSDFRLTSAHDYKTWYKLDHKLESQLSNGEWQYGLSEVFREEIANSNRVANPGCFATTSLLGLAPLAASGLIASNSFGIAISAVSGSSGGGKKLSDVFHFSHADSNVYAYKVGTHQHVGEITQTLRTISPEDSAPVSMTTHVVPMTRGICSTINIPITNLKLSSTEAINRHLMEVYRDFYQDKPFVEVRDTPPQTTHYVGSNRCGLYFTFEERTGYVIVVSVTDNLVKGASGQALQNANIMFGLEETLGLPMIAVYP